MNSKERLERLRESVELYSTAPTLDEMPRRTLADKGIAGPTGAHVVEELHTPLNLDYVTFTTGSTAFQNLVGVVYEELPGRTASSARGLELAGVGAGDHILFTYPPLVNLFPAKTLENLGISWSFLRVSSRDAFLLALCEDRPQAVVGESSFLRAALEDADRMGLEDLLPRDTIYLAAGTPLDPALPDVAKKMFGARVHDLYGCQEFGWLTLDGLPLREDIHLLPTDESDCFDLAVGGLPTGDRFPVLEAGHRCNPVGKIITYARQRTGGELETTVLRTTAKGRETVERLAKTILRIKARIVRCAPELELGADHTVLSVGEYGGQRQTVIEKKTDLFDALLEAQQRYQAQAKNDPAWIKRR